MGLEMCSLPGYDRPQHQLSLWLEYYNWILQEKLMVEIAAVGIPVTQSSSLSVKDHTVRCVVGSEPTSMDF